MEKSQFDEAFVPFFRRDKVAEAACRIGEHGCHQRGGNMNIRPVSFPDVEMVRMLFGKSLKPFHKVRKRAEKRFSLIVTSLTASGMSPAATILMK